MIKILAKLFTWGGHQPIFISIMLWCSIPTHQFLKALNLHWWSSNNAHAPAGTQEIHKNAVRNFLYEQPLVESILLWGFSYCVWTWGIWSEVICLYWAPVWACRFDIAAICCARNCIWGCLALIGLKELPSIGNSDWFSILTCTIGLSFSTSITGRGVDGWRLRILSNCCCCGCCWKVKFWGWTIGCICGCICLGICTFTKNYNEISMLIMPH